jgi:hypothetical protein
MTSDLDCDTEGGEKALAAMRRSPDWAAFALALPMRAEPGSQYAYCSCNNHLLSTIITANTGKSLLEFAKTNLSALPTLSGRLIRAAARTVGAISISIHRTWRALVFST